MVIAGGRVRHVAVRLEQASAALWPEARSLMADVGGPLDVVVRMASSDTWGGPFADHLRAALRWIERDVAGWGEHLGRLCAALDCAAREAENATRLEAAGIVPSFDLPGALAPWCRWPAPSPGLPVDWAAPTQRGSVVWVFPDRARQLAEAARRSADPLRATQQRVVAALAELTIDAPAFLQSAADGLDEIAAEIDRPHAPRAGRYGAGRSLPGVGRPSRVPRQPGGAVHLRSHRPDHVLAGACTTACAG